MDNQQPVAPEVSAPVATSDDMSRQVATEGDKPRQAPIADEYISLKEALAIFHAKGRALTERTLQRYCDKLQLSGQKRITAEGEKWFVTRSSVMTRIKKLDDFDKLRVSRQAATSPDMSAPVAEVNAAHLAQASERQGATADVVSAPVAPDVSHPTSPDLSRQAATQISMKHRNRHQYRAYLQPSGSSTSDCFQSTKSSAPICSKTRNFYKPTRRPYCGSLR